MLAAVQDFTNEDVAFLFKGSLAKLGRNDESFYSQGPVDQRSHEMLYAYSVN